MIETLINNQNLIILDIIEKQTSKMSHFFCYPIIIFMCSQIIIFGSRSEFDVKIIYQRSTPGGGRGRDWEKTEVKFWGKTKRTFLRCKGTLEHMYLDDLAPGESNYWALATPTGQCMDPGYCGKALTSAGWYLWLWRPWRSWQLRATCDSALPAMEAIPLQGRDLGGRPPCLLGISNCE